MASKTTKTKIDEKQNLANFIKSVHGDLRKQVQKANGDFHSVWQGHCRNSSLLQEYSQSMKELAVEHWQGNNLRRIAWCRDVCVEYFYRGGLEKCLRKDCRRVLFNLDQHQDCGCQTEADNLQLRLNSDDYQVKRDKLVLLDVGSCFNPFQVFSDVFIPVAIDLCPAEKSVFACDFLFVDVIKDVDNSSESNSTSPGSSDSTLSSHSSLPDWIPNCVDSGSKITKLPRNSFDVVVFCLLLSYFPARIQRWTCCVKAHQLLKDDGLLLIITPDSSHQNKNMAMIKSWKIAIEGIGFLRWKYYKDDHTHCMAFRKKTVCRGKINEESVVEAPHELLYIHQELDQNFAEEDGCSEVVYTEEKTTNLAEGFNALPFA